jgi:cyanate lyase
MHRFSCSLSHQLFIMSLSPLSTTLLAAKRSKGITFAALEDLLGRDEVWIASLFYGQSTASAEEADTLVEVLGLDPALKAELMTPPVKGCLDPVIPTDPLIYRFYEIMQVYGLPLKDVIQEKFGDGIMSAIDFTMDVDKVEDPAGNRVKVTMCGKFLPYKKW